MTCYTSQLNQVFMNLLSNAIDALEEHSKHHPTEDIKANSSQITIHTTLIDRSSANELAFVRIAISDNGPGMSEQVQIQAIRSLLYHQTNRQRNGFRFVD